MATRIAVANGLFSAAASWGVVDATTVLDSQAGNFTVATGPTFSQGATIVPGAITIDGIAVKIATRAASPNGTLSVRLFNVTAAAAVAGTTVTINIADIDDDQGTAGATVDGCSIGWYFFKFAAPVLLLGATNYRVEASTSIASQINLFRDATANNMSRMLRTTTTGAPGAADALFVLGEWTAAATMATRTITMDSTAATDYGTASTTVASVGISKGGTVTYGTAAATNYVWRISGVLQVWLSGTLNIGTVALPVPATSTAVLEFDCAATVDFGVIVWGTLIVQGVARTAGKNVVRTLLTADYVAAGVTLTVADDTGWLSGDEIAVSGTSRTTTDAEATALTAGPGTTALTVTAMAINHGGSAATGVQADVILLTRNVLIRSTLSSAGAYVRTLGTSTVDVDWCVFRYVYGTSASKTGFQVSNTGGAVTLDYVCFRDSATSARHVRLESTIAITWSNITCWMSAAVGLHSFLDATSSQTGNFSVTDWASIVDSNTSGTAHIIMGMTAGTRAFTRLYLANGALVGLSMSAINVTTAFTVTTASIHGMNGSGIAVPGAGAGWTLTGVNIWRTNTSGVGEGGIEVGTGVSDVTLVDVKLFGNAQQHIGLASTGALVRWRFVNALFAGDTSFATPRAINVATTVGLLFARFENSTFGVASGIYVAHTTADIGSSGSLVGLHGELVFVNSPLASATEFEASVLAAAAGYFMIARQRKDGTTNTHERLYPRVGTVAYDAATYRTAMPSEKLTPTSLSLKLRSAVKRIAVPIAQAATIGVYVQKDASYTGAAPRLVVKANPALGIDADTILDTMAGVSGTWELLTGTASPVAEEDGVLEAYVDCDGNAGNVYCDDWRASTA